jgi:hypothetical protein
VRPSIAGRGHAKPDRRRTVWLGFHYRNSVEQGVKLGNHVANWELENYFEEVHS